MEKPNIDDVCEAFHQFLGASHRAQIRLARDGLAYEAEMVSNREVLRSRLRGLGLEEHIDWERRVD